MQVDFATCCRSTALKHLQKVLPDDNITDSPEDAGPLLDLVERDILRVQDPLMYGSRIGIIPGKNYDDSHRQTCQDVCNAFSSAHGD